MYHRLLHNLICSVPYCCGLSARQSTALKIHNEFLDLSLIRSLTNVFQIANRSDTNAAGDTREIDICFLFAIISSQAYCYEPRQTFEALKQGKHRIKENLKKKSLTFNIGGKANFF